MNLVKRILDISISITGIVVLFPLFLLVAILIRLDSKGGILYRQRRVGRGGRDFVINKFRTMSERADKNGLLTIGGKDPRVTKVGYYLRRYKLDELPQLYNVLTGDMSLVGPRPEVRKYVDLYTEEQKKVLTVRPGITDLASISYRNESEMLAAATDPEAVYIQVIMPEKIRLNMKFIENPSLKNYFSITFKTVNSLIRH